MEEIETEERLKIKELKKYGNKKILYSCLIFASKALSSILGVFSGFSIAQAVQGKYYYGESAVNYELAGLSMFIMALLILAVEPYCEIKRQICMIRKDKISKENELNKGKSL